MRNKALPILIAVLVVLGIGLGIYLTRSKSAAPTATSIETSKPPNAGEDQTRQVKVYGVVVENNQARLQATTQTISAKDSVIEATIRALIEQGSTADLTNPIPKGTELLGVQVRDGLAKVDFSREFRENFTGGSEGEALVIAVILRTMAQFDEVKKVQILVEGKPVDSLGHADLSQPLDVRMVGSEFGER